MVTQKKALLQNPKALMTYKLLKQDPKSCCRNGVPFFVFLFLLEKPSTQWCCPDVATLSCIMCENENMGHKTQEEQI